MSKIIPPTSRLRQRAPRRVFGAPCAARDFPVLLATFEGDAFAELADAPGVVWHLALRRMTGSAAQPVRGERWINLKLYAARGQCRHKANYWPSWEPFAGHFNKHPDAGMLRDTRPVLCAAVEAALRVACKGLTRENWASIRGSIVSVNGVRADALCPIKGIVSVVRRNAQGVSADDIYPLIDMGMSAAETNERPDVPGADLI